MRILQTAVRFVVPSLLLGFAMVWVPEGSVAQGVIIVNPPPPGGPLPGLSDNQIQRFNAGRNEFLRGARIEDGLGPVFNGTACAQCHRAGAPGGASADRQISEVTRIGALTNNVYTDLVEVGGALIQARSLREIIQNYPVPREVVPSQAQFISRRITTPVFGLGLIEAIPEAQILQRADPDDLDGNGISGRPNMIVNAETGATEVGRFGWKCQLSSIHVFSADAFVNEMGITNLLFPNEVKPQGQNIPPGADTVADPEDANGGRVNRVTDFMRFSNAPAGSAKQSVLGRNLFTNTGCATCHTPSMTTDVQAVASLSQKQVRLYSDLLLHDMGQGLADGVQQGQAAGAEWRTAPLWGLRFRPFLLHDGRATSPDQAIRLHGGEAAAAAGQYAALSASDRSVLLTFLQGL